MSKTLQLGFYITIKINLPILFTALIFAKIMRWKRKHTLTNLPVDVLELIMKRLSLKDCLGLRAICRSCRKTISNVIENKHCCHLPELPLVVLLSKNSRFYYSLSTKSLHHLRAPLWQRTNNCFGSVEGWLIVGEFSEEGFVKFFFLNPVTDVRIMKPSKLHLPSNYSVHRGNILSSVRKMVASSKPNCDGSYCYLVGLLSDIRHTVIYKLFDKSWTSVEPDKDSRTYFTDVEIIGTKFYLSDISSNSLFVYDLKDSTNGPPKAEVSALRLETISDIRFGFLAKDGSVKRVILHLYVL